MPQTQMTLFWSSRSPFARKVMMTAHELGVADRITLRAEVVTPTTKSDVLRAANPLGQLPTLVLADGTAIADSHVICDTLDHLAGRRLIPANQPRRAEVLKVEALADGVMDKALKWLDERFRPEDQRSQERIDAIRRDIGFALEHLDRQAGLADDLSDLGSITVAAMLAYLDFRFAADVDWRAGRPQLTRWFETVSARPSMQATAFKA